jgi:hypothetical protein
MKMMTDELNGNNEVSKTMEILELSVISELHLSAR